MPIVSSQLMSRLAPALLRSVLHLEPVALLLMELTEVRNVLRMVRRGVRRWAHSNSCEAFGVFGADWLLCCRLCVECRSESTADNGVGAAEPGA